MFLLYEDWDHVHSCCRSAIFAFYGLLQEIHLWGYYIFQIIVLDAPTDFGLLGQV